MGMFDDVQCFYPLPWPEAQNGWFQSKTTPDQYLTKYRINAEGQLLEPTDDYYQPLDICGEIEIHAYRSMDNENYEYSVRFWFRDGLIKDAICNKRLSSNQSSIIQSWEQGI